MPTQILLYGSDGYAVLDLVSSEFGIPGWTGKTSNVTVSFRRFTMARNNSIVVWDVVSEWKSITAVCQVMDENLLIRPTENNFQVWRFPCSKCVFQLKFGLYRPLAGYRTFASALRLLRFRWGSESSNIPRNWGYQVRIWLQPAHFRVDFEWVMKFSF